MADLQRHPESRGDALRSVQVEIDRQDSKVRFSYWMRGALDRLRIPAPRVPRFAEGLWRHTCCEVFIARGESSAYHEFNFSPSGEWAAYAFSAYRKGAPLSDEALNPMIRIQREGEALRLEGLVRCAPGRVALGLSAVIEQEDGALSYWALRHPPGAPDFHRREAFALELA